MSVEHAKNSSPQKPLISINPTTAKELGRITPHNVKDIDICFEKSQNSFAEWSALSVRERQLYLKKVYNLIIEEKLEIAELITREQGKPVPEALAAEIIATLGILKDLFKNAHKELKDHKLNTQQLLLAHKKNLYRFEPYGVIVIISPWNFPFSVPVPEIAAALVAGNTVIFKPAPQSILVGQTIDSLFQRAGFPTGVFQTLYLDDSDASNLTEHDKVSKIIFTGSTRVGQKIMCSAATHITPYILELGGKDAAIIAQDANLERAAKGCVWGATFGSGQVCASVERVYIEDQAAEKFISLCKIEMEKITVGNPLDPGTDMGPLSVAAQLNIVEDHLNDAVKKGATILFGGERIGNTGYFFQPTLLTNVDHSMKIMTEETFGPVLPIMKVDSINDAIYWANKSPYGLSAYGWTHNKNTAERLMKELQAGTVMINDATSSWGEATAPWGGFKKSGVGRTRSRFGLLEMVQVKYTSFDKEKNKVNLWWHPYEIGARDFFLQAIDLLYSFNLLIKINSILKMITNKRFVTSVHWGAILKKFHKLF